MKVSSFHLFGAYALCCLITLQACDNNPRSGEVKQTATSLSNLETSLISCGPEDKQFGDVSFPVSGDAETQSAFNLGVKLLHSFEYEEAEKVFSAIAAIHPDNAMAYWGIAMSNLHPLWTAPTETELQKGTAAIKKAVSLPHKTKREESFINALAAYYNDEGSPGHYARCVQMEKVMEENYHNNPDDAETAIFYALSLVAAANPDDTAFARQKEAGDLLHTLSARYPEHPGIIHYTIHSYDYPGLAKLALPAARRYASVAPSSAHALHMPSHIFTRLGLWEEDINSNLASVSSAQCYAKSAGLKGHWDEELHGMDYLVYAYLQRGDNKHAKQQQQYLDSMSEVSAFNFKVAYAFAAMPARYVLENKLWQEAANLPLSHPGYAWHKFKWQEAIVHYTRLLGAAHTNRQSVIDTEWEKLNAIYDSLKLSDNAYLSQQVEIQLISSEAWLRLAKGKTEEALLLMKLAADKEDKIQKHPVTPGEVIPARELYADMLSQVQQWDKALHAYEVDLALHPNRFNGLYGAAVAAFHTGNAQTAFDYYKQLLASADTANADRPELSKAKQFVSSYHTLAKN